MKSNGNVKIKTGGKDRFINANDVLEQNPPSACTGFTIYCHCDTFKANFVKTSYAAVCSNKMQYSMMQCLKSNDFYVMVLTSWHIFVAQHKKKV